MKKSSDKKLINTNPHLKDPKARALAIAHMVQSSSAVEDIEVEIKTIYKDGRYEYKVTSSRKK